jgi:hypothetical protein
MTLSNGTPLYRARRFLSMQSVVKPYTVVMLSTVPVNILLNYGPGPPGALKCPSHLP